MFQGEKISNLSFISITLCNKRLNLKRENMCRERNTGWERDRFRGKRVSPSEETRRVYVGNRGKAQQHYAVTNWRDNRDITSFYFTRFGDAITERELWYHFKKWGDVREIFIPNRRKYTGRRYGFVRFKGIRDTQYTARQLNKIVIG